MYKNSKPEETGKKLYWAAKKPKTWHPPLWPRELRERQIKKGLEEQAQKLME